MSGWRNVLLVFAAVAVAAAAAADSGMYVESYWESWVLEQYPDDYCALLSDAPATPVGTKEGVNWVDIGKKKKLLYRTVHVQSIFFSYGRDEKKVDLKRFILNINLVQCSRIVKPQVYHNLCRN